MKLIYSNAAKRFELWCDFKDRVAAKRAGFFWDAESKRWYTQNVGTAQKLRPYADQSAKKILDRHLIQIEPWQDAVPTPAGKELRPFQIEAALFALSRNRSYLALDPGLGKTVIAAACVNADPGPVLYITPPFLKLNVEEEFSTWVTKPAPLSTLPDSIAAKPTVVAAFAMKRFKWCFIDEAHRFKNPKAQRTKAVLALAMRAERVVCLSGTPMPNGQPIELFPVLQALAPEVMDFRNFFEYARHFCGAYRGAFGWDFSGARNLPELKAKLKPFMLRMKKEDVLKELPDKTEQVVLVDGRMSKALGALEAGLEKGFTAEELVTERAGEAAAPEYRRLMGVELAPHVAKYADFLLDETAESLLIFAWHRDVIALLEDELAKWEPLTITGDVPMEARHALVKHFQAGRSRVFILQIAAAGVGLTLTKATRVLFAECSWVPGENDQASDRAHRIGQKDNVLVQFFAFRNSFGVRILKALLKKRGTTAQLMG